MVWKLFLACVAVSAAAARPTSDGQPHTPQPLTETQRAEIEQGLRTLQTALESLRDRPTQDAAVFRKGIEWALHYDHEFTPADVELLQRALKHGQARAAELAQEQRPWSSRRGKLALGYVSRVDGSVQPYGVIIPANYDSTKSMRLDVVLHGSTRPVGMSELRFMARFDESDDSTAPPDQPFVELHPLGRVENCYRWAGETDVFDAIEDVCRRYKIDRDRIVLRGMSMGASGTWHLGLKHPGRFAALGPYCGYVDTHRFSETPLPTFVKVGPLPAHQELALHMLDSIDYAANAGVVPAVACMGEKDVFFQAHVLMGEAMRREGTEMVNLISPGTGHVIDPKTHAEQLRRIGEHVERGLDRRPRELRFVTWTLKYSECHWLAVLGLERHYARAELSGRLGDGVVEIAEPQNITRFAVRTPQLDPMPKVIRVGAVELRVPDSIAAKSQAGRLHADRSPGIVVVRRGESWQIAGALGQVPLDGKRPGLQGPIDDAFSSPFLCVRGTGRPWNPAVQAYADASLKRFADEWHHYFRGELPIKDDAAVTDEDIRSRNLILFGDPGSNAWIGRALPHLPITWSKETLRLAGHVYFASDHLPALISPSPLPGGADRYVVLNSDHTFRAAELAKLNYLLFPRWGDWAVLKIDPSRPQSAAAEETVVRAGYFDEQWRVPDQSD